MRERKGKYPPIHNVVDFIIYKRKRIEIFFVILTIISAFCYMFVDVNYDITKYLPSTTKSQEGLKILKKEFGYPGTARIMVDNVTYYEAQNYKNQIESVEGVDSVHRC